MLAGLAFCEMLSQYTQSAFQGSPGVARGCQQQFATQTLCVRLLGLDCLGERFGFFFFSVRGQGKGRRRPRRWPGGSVLFENRGGGVI